MNSLPNYIHGNLKTNRWVILEVTLSQKEKKERKRPTSFFADQIYDFSLKCFSPMTRPIYICMQVLRNLVIYL